MGMDGAGLSVADALALENNRNCCNNGGMFGGDGIWSIFFLFFLLAWGGNAWGRGGYGGGYDGGALTRGELCQDMNFQQVENGVRGIQQGLCDGFYAMNTGMLNGFSGVQRDLCTGFNGVAAAINQARFDAQQCCCETNRNIDSVKYQQQQCCCDIMQNNDRNTQRIIDHLTQNEIQGLRDQLQTANMQLSQQAQSASLISELRPCAKPAYITCSPYTSYGYPFAWGFNNGCGCNSGCGCC